MTSVIKENNEFLFIYYQSRVQEWSRIRGILSTCEETQTEQDRVL